MNYLIDHLKGQHTLKRSLLINLIGGYIASIAISVNGHKQSQIDDLLPWNYAIKV